MAKSPDQQTATMIANCKEKTGKTLEQWLKITRSAKLSKHGEIVKMLKTQHDVTHGFANLIAHKTLESDAGSSNDQDLITLQYASGKEGLRPIYDALISAVQKFGNDVEISPKKAYVSLRRNKQFALIQPSTKTRVDVGLNLKSTDPQGRLEASGSFNSMVTHRVKIDDVKQVDKELVGWLKKAYEQS